MLPTLRRHARAFFAQRYFAWIAPAPWKLQKKGIPGKTGSLAYGMPKAKHLHPLSDDALRFCNYQTSKTAALNMPAPADVSSRRSPRRKRPSRTASAQAVGIAAAEALP